MDLDQIKWASESVETNNIILDVRTPEEFSEGYIANATNLNIYDANTFMSKIQSLTKKIAITYIVNQVLEVPKPVR